MAVKMVVDHYPVDSIKDAGSLFTSVWKKTVGEGRFWKFCEIGLIIFPGKGGRTSS